MSQHLRFDGHAPHRACPIVLLRAPEREAPNGAVSAAVAPVAATPKQRRRLWELSANLHCSIIGTCFSTAELRRVLVKAGSAVAGASDHDLHKLAVGSAGQPNVPAKLLNKALDRAHRLAIGQFARAADEDDVRALWQAARQRGEIPGAYWAVLTHQAAGSTLIAEAFGDVHMLSHLIGAANRADIRRLSALEAEKATLEAKVARQQEQLRQAVVSRDAKIRELTDLATRNLVRNAVEPGARPDSALSDLAADLRRDLESERARRRRVEERFAAVRQELVRERALRRAAEQRQQELRAELEVLEDDFAPWRTPSGRGRHRRRRCAAAFFSMSEDARSSSKPCGP